MNELIRPDEYFMRIALREAQKAFDNNEVPVGAVIIIGDQVISKAYNQVELLRDSTAHAEILALTSAYNLLRTKYLPEATLYVTIEPCLMCCGALYWSKLSKIVYGAPDHKNGYQKYISRSPFHPKTQVVAGILQEECADIMVSFFKGKR